MNIIKLVIGVILIIIVIYLFISVENLAVKFVGGGILAILGLAELITGLIKNGDKKF